jgi:predicted kinase
MDRAFGRGMGRFIRASRRNVGPLSIPEPSLVVLVGPSGAGKSHFARRHFRPTEVLSSDVFRGWVCDDENDQSASTQAFETLHFVASRRLALARLTVVDATNVQFEARAPLLALAREYRAPAVAIVFNVSERVCLERCAARAERAIAPRVIRSQFLQLNGSIDNLHLEGFQEVHLLDETTVEQVEIARLPRSGVA